MTQALNIHYCEQWKQTFGILKRELMQAMWRCSLHRWEFCPLVNFDIAANILCVCMCVCQPGPTGKQWTEEAEKEKRVERRDWTSQLLQPQGSPVAWLQYRQSNKQ